MPRLLILSLAAATALLQGRPSPAADLEPAKAAAPAEVKDPASAQAGIAWQSDYLQAMDLANRQKKMLFIVFHDPANPQSRQLETQALADATVRTKLSEFVCLRLAMDAKTTIEGHEIVLIKHAAFSEMLGRPGIAIADFASCDEALHGEVVSDFPCVSSVSYGPEEVKTMLDLPPGTLTQRTLIFAVRIHPEQPASATGCPDGRLLNEAAGHSCHQARIRLQGHHNWSSRFQRISGMLGCSAREVCAESWPGQRLLEGAIECVHSWRQSSGHWDAVRSANRSFGYDMKLGANGVWYATGIFAMR
jgi:Thioredoxin-like